MTKSFTRNIEDFTCEQCGFLMEGDGYTNHCTQCLWSKHVDVYPGDREELCRGMMEPITVSVSAGIYNITHRCVLCGKEKINKASKGDNFDMILQVSATKGKGK